ncbi:MAG TPA: glycosyltransferase family 4 protein [Kiritimatiellia bacterium]|nr:glycosyltransferase family 4 protein [Kiritimatiellia bacterium]HMO99333.1 glycosyltransferase family 4 protein [Kiritimatiellia bacterium]HMP96091.1 glycosyltransferase family 4 protein [Kiritimatiellia bacterium]
MPDPLAILSYYSINRQASGGARRVGELLASFPRDSVRLIQPGDAYPEVSSLSIRPDLGCRRVGINWGMFNYFLPATARKVRHDVERTAPRALVLCSIWCWAPFRRSKPSCPVVLDAQNVDAVAIAERYGWRHPFTRLVYRWERRVVNACDLIMTCSEVDRDLFMHHYNVSPGRLRVVPNGASFPEETELTPRRLDDETEKRLGDSRVLLFVGGKLDYPPNAEGLAFIHDVLMPELERRMPGRFKVMVIGVPVPDRSLHPSIMALGRVPDLSPYLRRADIGIAPIFSGSGTRLKVLDYLAWGKPVVATAKAVEGIRIQHDRDLLVAEAMQLADAVCALDADTARAAALGRSGRAVTQALYDWQAIHTQWRDALAFAGAR